MFLHINKQIRFIRARRLFKEPQICESLTWQVFSSTNVKRWQFSTDKNGTVSLFFLYHTTKQELRPSEWFSVLV